MVTAETSAIPRNACSASITARMRIGAVSTAALMARLESRDAIGHVIDFVDVVQQRRFLRRVIKVDRALHPRQVGLRPRLHRRRRSPAMPQQKLAQPMARPQLILLGRFPRADEIAQRFVRRVGHPHRRQVAGAITPRELQRVAPVRLDPIAGFDGHQRRRHHLALHPERRQLPIQHVPRRAGFITHAQLLGRSELLHQLPDRLGRLGITPNDRTSPFGSAAATAIVSAWTSRPINRTLLMTGSFACGSAMCGLQFTQRNPRAANRSRSFHCD